jgi:hypothetical protein
VPVYGVDPNANHALWGLMQPQGGLPATFLLDDAVWRLAAFNATTNTATYQGYYSGQQLVVRPDPVTSGQWLAQVTDPVHGNTGGTLNSTRNSVRLRDGRTAYNGNFQGDQINPTLNENNLHTIAADLDITGNVLTFGSLTQNAAAAGVTWQFADVADTPNASLTATLYQMLARPKARWVWSRPTDFSAQPPLTVMELDTAHKLTLYDKPATAHAVQHAGVVLDPAENGVSIFKGAVLVPESGDISMGDFHEGPEPIPAAE